MISPAAASAAALVVLNVATTTFDIDNFMPSLIDCHRHRQLQLLLLGIVVVMQLSLCFCSSCCCCFIVVIFVVVVEVIAAAAVLFHLGNYESTKILTFELDDDASTLRRLESAKTKKNTEILLEIVRGVRDQFYLLSI